MKIDTIAFVSKDTDDQLHYHRQRYEFHYWMSSGGRFEYGLKQETIFESHVNFIPPHVQHRLICDGRSRRFFYLLFSLDEEDDRLRQRLDAMTDVPSIPAGDYAPAFFDRTKQLWQSENPFERQAAHHRFAGFVFDMVTRLKPGADSTHESVEAAISIMQRRAAGDVSISEVAAEVGLDPAYFSRLFKQRLGITPRRYFNKLRVENACYLLNHNQMPIKAVAAELGFYDEHHFSRVFREFLGVTPAHYRAGLLESA